MERFRIIFKKFHFPTLVPKSKSIENWSCSFIAPSGDKMSGFWETPFCGFVYKINIDSGLYSELGINGLRLVDNRTLLKFLDRSGQSVDPCSGLKAVVVVIGIVGEDTSDVVEGVVWFSVVEPMFTSVVCSEVNSTVVVLVCLIVWAVENAVVINGWDTVDNGAVVVNSDVVVGLQK